MHGHSKYLWISLSGDSRPNGLNEQLYYNCMAMTDTCERWKFPLTNRARCWVIHRQNQYGQHQELKKPEHDLMLFTGHHMSNRMSLYTLTPHTLIHPAPAATVSGHHMSNCMSVYPHLKPPHSPSPTCYSFSALGMRLACVTRCSQNMKAQTFPESIALSHLASHEKKRSHLNKVVLNSRKYCTVSPSQSWEETVPPQ